jgi:hypothetical protein
MGHIRLGMLPATRKWEAVVEILAAGAGAAQVAKAAMDAAERGLNAATDDPAVLEAFWLLIRIPLAARLPDFAAALRGLGLEVPAAPSLLDIAVAYSAAVDARTPGGRGRTDLAELAQLAGVETINATVGPRAQSLFGTGPDEVRAAFASLATPAQFGEFGRRFFARFGFRSLDYFVSRALPDQTGPDRRFPTVAAQNKFTDALRAHCDEASVIVATFAKDWFDLHKYQTGGDIGRAEARAFLGYAVAAKLTGEMRRREGRRGA